MDGSIKILLTSDLHLGASPESTGIPEKARINTFKKITAIAREHDIFLIAGDFFDNISKGYDVLDLVASEFKKLTENGTEIIYTPGQGETEENSSISAVIQNINATHIFSDNDVSTPYEYSKKSSSLFIYGMPVSSNSDFSKISKISHDGFHIGLFHVNLDFDNKNDDSIIHKLQKNDIKNLDLDFYALGRNHDFKMFKIGDRIIGAFPGSPEAVKPSETGDRFVISLTVTGNTIKQIKRLSVNTVKLCKNTIDCTDLITMGPIKELLENNKSKKVIQSLVLSGSRNFVMRKNELENYNSQFYKLNIIDECVPTVEALIEEYEYENSLRGDFFKILKEKIEGSNIPGEVDIKDLTNSLNKMTNHGFIDLEDWLCNL